MNIKHLKYLVCPICQKELVITHCSSNNNYIKNGILQCSECKQEYPIVEGIPRFVSPDNYTNNFGLEWTIHNQTQFDDFSGYNISKERFQNETKWNMNLKNEIILEAGSGSGRFTKCALETGAMVVSFDYSYAVDANYSSNSQYINLLLVQANIFEMPFRDFSFDKIFCFGVLQHTPNPENAFRELIKKSKNGGNICTDIYLKSFFRVFFTPKYLLRYFTKKMLPEKLYKLVERYINFMWPIAKIIMKIPVIGKSLNWRLMIADYSHLLKNADEKILKKWALLDTFDMLSPRYDYPQTYRTFYQWHIDNDLKDIEIEYGYNGIVGRAKK